MERGKPDFYLPIRKTKNNYFLTSMPIPKLSEATIRRYASTQSFQRGETYYLEGAVTKPIERGNTLQAEVEGSEVLPYRVNLSFDGSDIKNATCTCAYSYEGWCKHVVAVLLVCLRQPEKIEPHPPLERLLDRLDLVQTQRLLQELVSEQPELIDAIERHVNSIASAASITERQPSKPQRRAKIDPAPIRRQVKQILQEAVRYFEDGWEEDPLAENLIDVIQEAQEFTEQGDGHSAIAILEAITAACVEGWDDVADYGADNEEVVKALNDAWTAAILIADITPQEQVDLRVNLEEWQDEWDADFLMSLEALQQGWGFPPLKRVLEGEITSKGAWEGESPEYADDLALIRLQILERQERYEEYLYLARAEGQTERYLTMLARLGRIEEAIAAAQTQMRSMEEAFALAQSLQDRGALMQALKIAQTGLTLQGNCQYDLAVWTSNLAEGLGDIPSALMARVQAFKAKPEFGDYRLVEYLAGENWKEVKAELLAHLRTHSGWGISKTKVDIFLHEELIDDAIATVSNLSYYQEELIRRVMEKAIGSRPDWVIDNAKSRAESIMDRGKAEVYYHAVEWLKLAREAYKSLGKQSEWSAYRDELMQTHARKYKLMAMLKARDLE